MTGNLNYFTLVIKMSTYVIAEIGNTHEGVVGLAKQFIKYAAECGVDCVKLQTHIFESESLDSAPNPPYFSGESRREYFERTSYNLDQYLELKKYAEEECKVDFISSPFSIEAVELLEQVDIKKYKIPSGEVSNIPLLVKIANTKKPVILSSGMSSWEELDLAVDTLKNNGCNDLTVLQCTSEYPCPPEKAGLNVLEELKERYKCSIGYSDHTMGTSIPVAAVVKGASLIEKHFTLSRMLYGSDAANSTEPQEFKRLVDDIRAIERALVNPVDKDQSVSHLQNMKHIFEKSIVSAVNIDEGDVLTADMLAYKKPGNGIPAKEYMSVIGKKTNRSIPINTMLDPKMFE